MINHVLRAVVIGFLSAAAISAITIGPASAAITNAGTGGLNTGSGGGHSQK